MDSTTLHGLSVAQHFAKTGRFIFAIKYLEKANPGISRKDAIAAVQSFGLKERDCEEDDQQGVSAKGTLLRRL